MGYAANSYELFKTLTEPSADSWARQEGQRLLSQFKLFGLIIVDPDKDQDFYTHMKKNFEQYSLFTGKDFLFFAVIKPEEHQPFKFHNFSDKNSWLGDLAAESTDKISISVQTLCNVLGISYSETPSILLTTNFLERTFAIVQSSVKKIELQLITLGKLAIEFKEKELNNNTLKRALESWTKVSDKFESYEYFENKRSVSKELYTFLQYVKAGQDRRSDGLSKSLKSSFLKEYHSTKFEDDEKELSKLTSLITLLSDDNTTKYSQNQMNMDSMVCEALTNYNVSHPNLKPAITEYSIEDISGLEIESKNFFKTGKLFLKMLRNDPELSSLDDFSGYCIQICKGFELEINLSIVQAIREYLGIEMPEYYNILKPIDNDYPFLASMAVSNPRPIYFNRASKGRWLPPGLGESNICYRSILYQNKEHGFNTLFENPVELADLWQNINRVRQASAHTSPVKIEDINQLNKNLQILISKGMLTSMIKLKRNKGVKNNLRSTK